MLLENTEADGDNGILKNPTTTVPLKYLSNFWRSLIDFKVKLKPKWAKCFVLSTAGNDNVNDNVDDNNGSNIIFTIKDTKLYVSVVTISARDNQKNSKVYWNEYKTKSENKNTANKFRCFLESNFVGVISLFVLVYSNKVRNAKKFNAWKYYLPKGIIDNYHIIINRKNFYDQPIDSGIKRYKEIRKLTAGKGEDYTTGCLLDYVYIKNHCRSIAAVLSRQK